jgi:sigma-B regulation protein RsbU (phosphoserine phosphatase)
LHSIRARLFLGVLLAVGLVFAASQYVALRLAERELLRATQREAELIAHGLAQALEAVLGRIEARVQGAAAALAALDPSRVDIDALLDGLVQADDRIYGSTIAFEPHAFAPRVAGFAPYLHRDGPSLRRVDLARAEYAYRKQDWYRLARDSGRPRWSEPYFDRGGGEVWMITYSVPFRRRGATAGSVSGIVTADLTLAWVRESVGALPVPGGGFGFLVSPSGTFISHLEGPAARSESGGAEVIARLERLRGAGTRLMAGGQPLGRVAEAVGGPVYLAYRPLGNLGWSLGLVFPEQALMAPIRQLLTVLLTLAGIGLGLLVLVVSVVSRRITRPLEALAGAVARIGRGDLDVPIPASRHRDEVAVLGDAVDHMRLSLRQHIDERARSLAERERLAHELDIARQIQEAMLPRADAADADGGAFRVAALLRPAREVGGDLYDFFALDDRHLLFTVGDVTDKGIPAALFMSQVSGLFRVIARSGVAPDELCRELDDRLSRGNDACMFVTMTCGILDGETGVLTYASAGHEPPLARRLGGSTAPLPGDGGPALGLGLAAECPRQTRRLAPGDAIVAFTDGVTEAFDTGGRAFGTTRLRDLVAAMPAEQLAELPVRVMSAVERFAEGGGPRDDVTVLVVEYRPPDVVPLGPGPEEWRLDVPAGGEGVMRALARIEAILRARDLPEDVVRDCRLIGEEALTNIAAYAYEGRAGAVTQVKVRVTPDEVRLRFADTGAPFNPLAHPEPDLDVGIAERSVGGLGILLIRRLATRCEYARDGDRNVLTVYRRVIGSPTASPVTQEP